MAPLSKLSIPRLQLLSALILARLIGTVMSAIQSVINIEKIHCWTDSLTALFWIQGRDKEWKMFVENRVIEIRSWVQTECWSHCPGVDNPADIPPRGMTATQLKNNRVWFHGPSWLVEIENKWPTGNPQTSYPTFSRMQWRNESRARENIRYSQLRNYSSKVNFNHWWYQNFQFSAIITHHRIHNKIR